MTPQILKVTGFLPFLEEVNINFIANPHAVVSGPNGVGKSSLIIDGIVYSLFGEARQKSKGLINSNVEQSFTEFQFSHKGNECVIQRYATIGKTSQINFKIGEIDATERTLTDTQARINEFLGFSKKLLLTTCIASQEESGIFSAMGPLEREQILTTLLDLDIWTNKKVIASRWLSSAKHNTERVKEIERDNEQLEREIINLQEKKDELAPLLVQLEAKYDAARQAEIQFIQTAAKYDETVECLDRIEAINKKIINNQKWFDSLCDVCSLEQAQEQETALDKDLKEVQINLEEIKIQLEKINKERTEAKEFESYLQAYQKHEISAGILEKVPCVGLDIHNTCELLQLSYQSSNLLMVLLEKHNKTSLTDLVEEAKNKTINTEEQYKKWDQMRIDIENYIKHAFDKQKDVQRDLNLAQERIERLELQAEWSEEVRVLEERLTRLPKGEMKGLHLLTEEKNRLQNELDRTRIFLTKAEGEIGWREERVKKLSEEFEGMNEVLQEVHYYETLQSAYKEIPTSLLYETVPIIEMYANEILERISPDIHVMIRIHKENKEGKGIRSVDLLSISPQGSLPFENLSGSEKFRESLALRIALSRVIAETYKSPMNFFIIDEGFGCLDQVNVSIVKNTLKELANMFKMFYIISHVEELRDTFETEVLISRTNPQVTLFKHDLLSTVMLDQ